MTVTPQAAEASAAGLGTEPPSRSESADYFELCLTTVIIDVADSLRAFRGDDDAYSERVAANVKDLRRALFDYERSRLT